VTSFGVTELLIVLAIVVLILGPKRLPSLGRQLGGGIRELKKSIGGSSTPESAGDAPASAGEAAGPASSPTRPTEDARPKPVGVDAVAERRTP
jgi:sec-independent protein translocase protein TatA